MIAFCIIELEPKLMPVEPIDELMMSPVDEEFVAINNIPTPVKLRIVLLAIVKKDAAGAAPDVISQLTPPIRVLLINNILLLEPPAIRTGFELPPAII